MNAEKILDAMQYLPEELLLQTDRLRQRKTVRWQHLAAMAACLCLVLGLAMGLEQVAEKSTCDNGSAENLLGDAADGIVAGNSSVGFWWATVVTVETERITVILQDGTEAIVLLEKLENIPQVTPGQRLRLYLHENNIESEILIPYKIEIEDEKP